VLRFKSHEPRNLHDGPLALDHDPALTLFIERRTYLTWSCIALPLVEQDLTIIQEHQKFQFANDLMAIAIDPMKITFSNESRFVLGDDHRWRHPRRGE
jgi:hypothetical protein